jgi:dienelactone hydrolase
MRLIVLCVVCVLAFPLTIRAQQTATESREGVPPGGASILDLSGEWRVNTVSFLDEKMTLPDFDDHDWRTVKVPARWSEQGIEAGTGMPKVAIYRRTFRALADWGSKPVGIAAWLFPARSTVFLNGKRVEPKGESPWQYASITDLLKADGDNLIAVTTQFDGVYEMAFPNSPRVGPIGTWDIPALQTRELTITIGSDTAKATLYTLPGDNPRPGVLMISTGSHGLAFTEGFIPLARELAYAGYVAMPAALNAQTEDNINAALDTLRQQPGVAKDRIAVIAGVSSAVPVLEQVAAKQSLKAVVTLSTKDAPGAKGLNIPVLLIATNRDQTGPASTYAQRIAANLAGPHDTVILPGTENGLGILEPHWNIARQAILNWFDKYLAAKSSL